MQKKIFLTLLLPLLLIPVYAQESAESSIPSWIKSSAGWWSEDKLTDEEYVEALEFLIESEIIVLPNYQKIPPTVSELDLLDDFDIFDEIEKDNNLEGEIEAIMAESEIQVSTDKTSYLEGESIIISGSVTSKEGSTPVTLQIFTSSGNLIDILQTVVSENKTYSYTVLIEGPSWHTEYEYIVRASYGEGNVAETEFNIT